MIRWEYKRVGHLLDADLNDLGRQGWELVAINPTTLKYVFKRPRQDTKVHYLGQPKTGPRR